MVIKIEDMKSEQRERMRGGEGTVGLLSIVPADDLPAKARLFSVVTLQKGCSIGSHIHENETEIFYILEGEGMLNDNGVNKTLRAGDCNVCPSGHSHAIANEKEEPLKFIAAIVLD